MVTEPFDGRLQRRQAVIPRLVETLRGIHDRTASRVPAPALALEHLMRGSRDLTSLLGGGDASLRYGSLRGQMERLEQQTREHSAMIDRLLKHEEPAGDAAGIPAPYQETLYLQCRRDSRTAGRFRCINRRGRKVAVSLATRPFTWNGTASPAAPILSVQPSVFALDPGAAAMIVVDVDLRPCIDLNAGSLQTSIDLRMDEAIALKLWIEIDVYE